MSRILGFLNSAGGVGRTTSALSMAVAFSEYGKRTLLVDCDPQGALTFILGKEKSRRTVLDIFSGRGRALGMILQTSERVDLIPSSPHLYDIKSAKDDQILFKALAKFEYDIIIIDSGPGFGWVNRAVLAAADEVFIPTRLDLLSVRGGLQVAHASSNYRGRVRAVLPTLVEPRSKHGNEMMTLLKEEFGELVVEQGIPKNSLISDAVTAGQSVLTFRKASEISGLYREITYEYL